LLSSCTDGWADIDARNPDKSGEKEQLVIGANSNGRFLALYYGCLFGGRKDWLEAT